MLGCLALCIWFFLSGADDTARALLRTALWSLLLLPILIAIPLSVIALVADYVLYDMLPPFVAYGVGMLWIVLFEEAIKLRAALLQTSGIRAFALVSLFGIFELALFKSLMMWGTMASGAEIFWLQSSLLPALAMHVLTAAIYAFHFRNKPAIQFSICVVIHFLFNLAADRGDIIGDLSWLATIIPLVAVTWWLIPRKGSAKRGKWQMEQAEQLSKLQ